MHWLVLLVFWIVASVLVAVYVSNFSGSLLLNAIADGWMLYICLWIRKLDPHSYSIFWCAAYIALEIGNAIATNSDISATWMEWISGVVGIAMLVVWLFLIYTVRSELDTHYNEREPMGLHLGPVLTFFFSFLYFQSQLYDIAKEKKRQAEDIPSSLIT